MSLDDLKILAANATDGEWRLVDRLWSDGSQGIYVGADDIEGFLHHSKDNAAHIAAWNPARALAAIALLRRAEVLIRNQDAAYSAWRKDFKAFEALS